VTIAIIVCIGLVVTGLGVVGFYYALWHGALKPLREQWLAANREARRRMLAGGISSLLFMVAAAVLVIVAPFGRFTIAYLMGGVGALLVIAIPICAAVSAWQGQRPKK